MRAHIDHLPVYCASRLLSTGEPIMLRAACKGYWLARDPGFDVEDFNAKAGVTQAKRQAMEIGSIFGFDTRGSVPDYHLTTLTTKMKAMRTTTEARQVALAMKNNAFYKLLRKRKYGARDAMEMVRFWEAYKVGESVCSKPDNWRSYPSGITGVVRGYWVFGH